MAHGYVRQPSDVVNEGDEVEAEVIDVNRKKKQIKLSIKALQPEPVKEEELPRVFTEPVRRERTKIKTKKRPPAARRTKSPRAGTRCGGNVDELLATINEPETKPSPPLWKSPCAMPWNGPKRASRTTKRARARMSLRSRKIS
jgi:small subunit ribosomal protein S1